MILSSAIRRACVTAIRFGAGRGNRVLTEKVLLLHQFFILGRDFFHDRDPPLSKVQSQFAHVHHAAIDFLPQLHLAYCVIVLFASGEHHATNSSVSI